MSRLWTLVWSFVKQHWPTVVLLLVSTASSYFIYRFQQEGFAATVAKLNAVHDAEVAQVNKVRVTEDAQHQQELERLRGQLASAEQRYEDAQARLEERRRQEQADLSKRYAGDPDGAARDLAARFGLTVVTP